jgi:hypothetical protein
MSKQKVVDQGESIASIAADNGHAPGTLWLDESNSALKDRRKNPYVLEPGDVVTIPDKRPKVLDCETSIRHYFQRTAVPDTLCLQLLYEGKARANLAYELQCGNVNASGVTDENGKLSHRLPPSAKQAVLKIGATEVYHLQLNAMDPESTEMGFRKRLLNLAFLDSLDAAQATVEQARRTFLAHNDMKPGETPGPLAEEKLRTIHGA